MTEAGNRLQETEGTVASCQRKEVYLTDNIVQIVMRGVRHPDDSGEQVFPLVMQFRSLVVKCDMILPHLCPTDCQPSPGGPDPSLDSLSDAAEV